LNRKNKKILVTGADGFIGSHLTEELVRCGYDVRAFVLYNSFNSWGWLDSTDPEILKSIDIFAGDIRDPHGVKKAMQGCDVVLNLAALIAIPYSYHSPDTYIDTNVKGALNVVQAARELSVQKVVQTSTSEVYGTARFVPITEAHPLQGQSPYSASKIGADMIAMSFFSSFETPVTIIRPLKKIKLGALHPTRDFNFVSDTVRGFIAAVESEVCVGEVINIGSNYEISVGDTVRLISDIMGSDVEIETETVRLRPEKSEVERLWADNAKAKQLLGWEPHYAGLDGLRRGLEETVAWFTIPENFKQYKSHIYNV
jgi:nucleoside-diphosphate-sugar epimerase